MPSFEDRNSSARCATIEQSEISIVPAGFEVTAHPIFAKFKRPTFDTPGSPSLHHFHDQARRGVDYLPRAIGSKVRASDLDSSCPICLREHLLDPVTLCGCTHSFCLNCLERWLDVAESCPLCKAEIGAFVSAAPGAHRLFTRPADTSHALQGGIPIVGIADALEVQRTLHRLLLEQQTSPKVAEETSDAASSSGISTSRARKRGNVNVVISSSSSGSNGGCSSDLRSSEVSRSNSSSISETSISGKRTRGATSDDTAGVIRPASSRCAPTALPKSMAEVLNHLNGDIAETRATLQQLESAPF